MLTTGLLELPVQNSLKVLGAFRAQNHHPMSRNQIYVATGSRDKPNILKSIDYLGKGKILESKKVNKQKKLEALTELGQEIIDFLWSIENCKEAYGSLREMINEYAVEINPNFRQKVEAKLLTKGWKPDERDAFYSVLDTVYVVENIHQSNIYNCLLYRYNKISTKYNVNNNAKQILLKIVLDEITQQLSIVKKVVRRHPISADGIIMENEPFDNLLGRALSDIEEIIYDGHSDIANRFVSKQVEALLSSLLYLGKPDLKTTRYAYGNVKLKLGDMTDVPPNEMKQASEKANAVLSFYEAYIQSISLKKDGPDI